MSVALGARPAGAANSPTRVRPSAVFSSMFRRSAGSTVDARISIGPAPVENS
jgi:hypothetical protein